MNAPTYTPTEIESMARSITEPEALKILATLINEEIELYCDEDLNIVAKASVIIFMRSLVIGSIKLLR